jgi:hypothetical protein
MSFKSCDISLDHALTAPDDSRGKIIPAKTSAGGERTAIHHKTLHKLNILVDLCLVNRRSVKKATL